MKISFIRKIALVTLGIVVLGAVSELVLRMFGFTSFQPIKFPKEKSFPSAYVCYSPLTGMGLIPGKFLVTVQDSLTYRLTQNEDSNRVTKYEQDDRGKRIFVMGCSFTWGQMVDDSLTFCWLLQKKLRNFNVSNFGIPASGTLQSYLQLKNSLQQGMVPAMVIVNYASFHDMRNTCPRFMKKLLTQSIMANGTAKKDIQPIKFPTASIQNNKLSIGYESIFSEHWRVSDFSALFNFMEQLYDRTDYYFCHSRLVTHKIIEAIHELCIKNNIVLVVTGISKDEQTTEMINADKNILHVDISVDLSNSDYTFYPIDLHPNALAHKLYAEKMEAFLMSHATTRDLIQSE